ncbi:MAG: hypothetical protein JSR48_08905 [Verrucomicrobia bacterium]|nr:hypothetical protein [Verrucomicrobiota bacterium]
MNSRLLLLLTLATASITPAARAQIEVNVSADIRLGRVLPPPPPEVVVMEQPGPAAPPPWTETHWYRRSRAYYYYPGCDVYYRPSDHVWFYLEGGSWRVGARLPDGIRVDFNRAVSLKLETDRPYLYHDKVLAYYPTNYFAKVKFKDGHDRRRDNDRDDRRDRDEHDRGRGKGPHH